MQWFAPTSLQAETDTNEPEGILAALFLSIAPFAVAQTPSFSESTIPTGRQTSKHAGDMIATGGFNGDGLTDLAYLRAPVTAMPLLGVFLAAGKGAFGKEADSPMALSPGEFSFSRRV